MTETITIPKLGWGMPDGTVFAGHSPDTGKAMYTTPADAPLTMRWKAAMEYASNLDANGHADWRVPSKAELNVLFNNRAFIGGFDGGGSFPAGWYWSSDDHDWNEDAAVQRFKDGFQTDYLKHCDSALRCVRG